MRVVIAGGHGEIALLLERLLAERGDQAVARIPVSTSAKSARQKALVWPDPSAADDPRPP